MIGIQHVAISSRRMSYEFDISRNITIVRGNSGTGKTTLYNMVADYTRLGDASGVNVSCKKSCVALIDSDWKYRLSHISDSIVFIDEGADFIRTNDFASAAKSSSNYYVIFNRESLSNLPYSVDEIYEIKTSGKFHSLERAYHSAAFHVYGDNKKAEKFEYVVLLTEDAGAGFQFFKSYMDDEDVICMTAASKSKILNWLKNNPDTKVLIIADGAAFGSEMDKISKWNNARPNMIRICLPESFEWLILKSGLIKYSGTEKILKNPADYIESSKFFSWENFFHEYLVRAASGTAFAYKKKAINESYLIKENADKIVWEIEGALRRDN